jgi:hypothetical protein
MNNIQNIIVYMWFVPAVGFIVLPLFWSLFGMLYRAVERSRVMDIKGYVVLNNQDAEGAGMAENRSRSRICVEEGRACIDEEGDCCRAFVSNISNHGICLRNIPRKMFLESSAFRVVFRTRQKDYHFMAKPIWKRMAEKGYVIGAEIERIPAGWKDLVRGLRQSSLVAEPA